MEISVHDNFLRSYSVEADPPRIVLHTEFCDREPTEFTDIVFDGVFAYHFENDTFGTVLFDVAEVDRDELLAENAARFENGASYGWPAGWDSRKESIHAFCQRIGVRAFRIQSSYGLDGWVLAESMTLRHVPPP